MKTILALALMVVSQIRAAEIRVCLQVDGRGPTNEVRSYFARELRSLVDVAVVSETEAFDYAISVIVLSYTNRTWLSYLMSAHVTAPFPKDFFDCLTSTCYSPAVFKQMKVFALNHDQNGSTSIHLVEASRLRETCGVFVTDIDNLDFEPRRKQQRTNLLTAPLTAPK